MISLKLFNKKSKRKLPKAREKHQWQLVSRSYATPVKSYDGINLERIPQDLAEKMMLGVTTYLWECLLTGDIRTEEILGSDSDILSELLTKVKQYGNQVIKDETGVTFTISLLPIKIDAASLPMRKV